MIRTLARIAAWLLAGFIAFATLSPIGMRPESGGPPSIERIAAYLLLGLGFCVGYPRRRWLVALGVVAFAAGLEAAQTLIPTRDGRLADALQKGLGALCGAALSVGFERLVRAVGRAPWLDGGGRRGAA